MISAKRLPLQENSSMLTASRLSTTNSYDETARNSANSESAELINVGALARALATHLRSALQEAIPAKRLMNVDEAAEYCGLTRDSFRKKVVRDRLRKVRLDKCWRFDKADLDVWIDEHKEQIARESGD